MDSSSRRSASAARCVKCQQLNSAIEYGLNSVSTTKLQNLSNLGSLSLYSSNICRVIFSAKISISVSSNSTIRLAIASIHSSFGARSKIRISIGVKRFSFYSFFYILRFYRFIRQVRTLLLVLKEYAMSIILTSL